MSRPGAADAVAAVFRAESGRTVALLARVLGDIPDAEDAVADAHLEALRRWPIDGIPANPAAWIVTVARNRAIDRLRRASVLDERHARIAHELEHTLRSDPVFDDPERIPDERLRLIFTCCHPALATETQVALTLRLVAGLTVPEIGRALLAADEAVAQRLVRARRKLRLARVPIRVPEGDELPERLAAVLAVVYLVFNEGYAATAGTELRRDDVAEEAVRLGRLVVALLPDQPEADGLLALMLLHHARRHARTDAAGRPVLLEHQRRSLWETATIREGIELTERAWAAGPPGPYAVQAAIAAVHAAAPTWEDTEWPQLVVLYGRLGAIAPSPVVELNRAVAVAMADGPDAGLVVMDGLAGEPALRRSHLLHAARADMLRRLERTDEAADAYRRAIDLAGNEAERGFLMKRLEDLAP